MITALKWYNPAPTMQLLQDQYIRPMSVLKRIHSVNEGEKKSTRLNKMPAVELQCVALVMKKASRDRPLAHPMSYTPK
jgi:hypothetical protein